jgi:hypothetical protein
MLTQDQLKANINAMEAQGASQQEIQQWLDSLKSPSATVSKTKFNKGTNSQIQNAPGALGVAQKVSQTFMSGITKGLSAAGNAVMGAVRAIPGEKKAEERVATAVGRTGAVMGAAGAAPFELIKSGTDLIRGKSAAQVYKESNERMGSVSIGTQKFGHQIGADAVPAFLVNEFGGMIPNAVLSAGQFQNGLEQLKTAKKPEDYVSAGIGMAMGYAGVKGLATSKDPGILFNKEKVGIIKNEVSNLRGAITGKSSVDKMIDTSLEKAIRPSVVNRRTATQTENYNSRGRDAVKTIVQNKSNLELNGEKGVLPKSLKDFSHAIEQTKRSVFSQYDAIQRQAGEQGAKINLNKVANELDVVAGNKVLNDVRPEVAKYAQMQADRFKTRGEYTTTEAQEAIRIYNEGLENFYKNPSYETASRAVIDAAVVNNMRSQLDSVIEKTTGEKYQELKNKYGALKTIEKDVNRRSTVEARKNPKGLIDFTDIFSGGQIMHGLLSLDPGVFTAGLAQKGIASWFKRMNDPNVIIKKMFESVDGVKPSVFSGVQPGLSIKAEGKQKLYNKKQGGTYLTAEEYSKAKYRPDGKYLDKHGNIVTPKKTNPPMGQIENPISKAKASGQSFDEWVKGRKTAEELGIDIKQGGHLLDQLDNINVDAPKIDSNWFGTKIGIDKRELRKQTTGKLTSDYWLKKINKGERPVVLVGVENGKLKVIDGNHKATAYLETNAEDIPTIFTKDARSQLRALWTNTN